MADNIKQQPSRRTRSGKPLPLTLTVTVSGETLADLETAMDRIKGQVAEGYKTGFDRNESGCYNFEVKGEENAP